MAILTAVDGDTVPCRATEQGYALAQECDEELVVLHVMRQEKYDDLQDSIDKGERANGGWGSSYPFQMEGPREITAERSRTSPSGGGSQFPIDDAEHWAEKVARRVVKETLGDYSDCEISYRGRVGDPVDAILNEARKLDAEYIVIGGRKRTPVGKAVFGSRTQSILLNTDKPVVTVMREE